MRNRSKGVVSFALIYDSIGLKKREALVSANVQCCFDTLAANCGFINSVETKISIKFRIPIKIRMFVQPYTTPHIVLHYDFVYLVGCSIIICVTSRKTVRNVCSEFNYMHLLLLSGKQTFYLYHGISVF